MISLMIQSNNQYVCGVRGTHNRATYINDMCSGAVEFNGHACFKVHGAKCWLLPQAFRLATR